MSVELKPLCPICFEVDCDHLKKRAKPAKVPDIDTSNATEAEALEQLFGELHPHSVHDRRSKTFPKNTEHNLTGTGRGPTGRLRNFKAMSDTKLEDVYDTVRRENNDVAAVVALTAEMTRRGLL